MQGQGKNGKKAQKYIEQDGFKFRQTDFAKGEYEVVGACDDMTASINIGIDALNDMSRRGGSCAKYPANEDGLTEFRERSKAFFEHINRINAERSTDAKILYPDIESWCCYLGISRKTLHLYYRDRGAAWRDTIDMVKQIIVATKKQAINSYRIPAMFGIFDIINTDGEHYINTNKVETKQNVIEQENERLSIDQQIEDAGLVYNEETQEFEPLRTGAANND